ncbi:MAG: flagellar basal body P-ring formation chaperone FlgA [Aquabacterium sp.]
MRIRWALALCLLWTATHALATGTLDASDIRQLPAFELHAESAVALNEGVAGWLGGVLSKGGVDVAVTPLGMWGGSGAARGAWSASITSVESSREGWTIRVGLKPLDAADQPMEASFRAQALAAVWAVAEPVRKGDETACTALRRETRPLAQVDKSWRGVCSELQGLRWRRPLMPGDVVMADDIGHPMAVQARQETVVLTRAGSIEVRAMGQALADAQIGARVPVKVQGGLKVIQAVVVGPATVQVAE